MSSFKNIIVVSFFLLLISACSSKNSDSPETEPEQPTNQGGSGGTPPSTGTGQPSGPYVPSQPTVTDIPIIIPTRKVPNTAVKIYRIDKKSKLTLLFSEAKLAGGTINPHIDELEDDKFYLIDVSNQVTADGLPVKGSGNKRLLAKGLDIKEKGSIQPTVLSEIFYIYAHSAMLYDFTHLEERLNHLVKTLVQEDIDGDLKITNKDILNFDSSNDSDKLSPRLKNENFIRISQKVDSNDLSYLNDIFKTKLGELVHEVDSSRSYYRIKVSEDETKMHIFTSFNTKLVDISDSSNLKIIETSNTGSLIPLNVPNKAYTISSNSLKIYDISDLSNIVLLNDISVSTSDATIKLSKDSSKAFILLRNIRSNQAGLIIYDLNTNKVLNGETSLSGNDFVFSHDEKYCFIASSRTKGDIYSVDISDLANPKLLSTFYSGGRTKSLDISQDSTKLYLAARSSGLVIVDVSKPESPVRLSGAYHMWVKGVKLSNNGETLIATGDGGPLIYYDVTNPKTPILTRVLDTYSSELYIANDNATIYNNVGVSGDIVPAHLEILDISTPINPNILTSFKVTSSAVKDVTINKNTMYVTDGTSGLEVLDISSPKKPRLLSSLNLEGKANNIALSNDKHVAFIANSSSGLAIVDLSSNNKPKILSKISTNGVAKNVTLSSDGEIAYVANGESGIVIIDVSDVKAPHILSSLETNGDTQKITLTVDGKKAFISNGKGDNNLLIVDVSTTSNPYIISHINTGGTVKDIKLSKDGKKAYVANGKKGVSIIDVSSYATPSIISTVDTTGVANDLVLSKEGTKLFIANGVSYGGYYNRALHLSESGLVILDITNPITPKIILKIENVGNMERVKLTGDESKAFIVDSRKGVQLINLEFLGEK